MIPPVCESDADRGTPAGRKHTLCSHTSHIWCVLSVTEYMDLETRGGKVINHASHSLVFFPLSPPLTFEATGGGVLFCVYCNSGGRGFSFSFFVMQIWFLFKQMGGRWGGSLHAACCQAVHKVLNHSKVLLSSAR